MTACRLTTYHMDCDVCVCVSVCAQVHVAEADREKLQRKLSVAIPNARREVRGLGQSAFLELSIHQKTEPQV